MTTPSLLRPRRPLTIPLTTPLETPALARVRPAIGAAMLAAVLLQASLQTAVAQTAVTQTTVAQPAAPAVPVTGEYFCVTGGTCPCQSDGQLKLAGDGRWYWGSHTGRWQADTAHVSFDGLGGAAALGPATIGSGTLTFANAGNAVVCWQPRPGVARPGSPD